MITASDRSGECHFLVCNGVRCAVLKHWGAEWRGGRVKMNIIFLYQSLFLLWECMIERSVLEVQYETDCEILWTQWRKTVEVAGAVMIQSYMSWSALKGLREGLWGPCADEKHSFSWKTPARGEREVPKQEKIRAEYYSAPRNQHVVNSGTAIELCCLPYVMKCCCDIPSI